MNIRAIIFMIFVAVDYSSCHPPIRHVPGLDSESISTDETFSASDCVAGVHQDTHSILHTRTKRSRSGKMSLSPQPATPPYTRPDNGTKTNTTLPIQQQPLTISSWIPTLESIITPIFRTVILVLTLFNINITWRIHALHVGRGPVRHHDQPGFRGWPV